MSWPSSTIEPPVGSMRRRTRRASVDLPEPLSPDEAECGAGLQAEVDAVDRGDRPVTLRRKPVRTGNCLESSTSSRRGCPVTAAAASPAKDWSTRSTGAPARVSSSWRTQRVSAFSPGRASAG